MTANGWLQIGVFLLAILAVTPLLGGFMARVFSRQKTWLDPVARPLERLIYKLTGVDEAREMRWTEYAVAVLMFSVVSMLVLYVMQRLQHVLPLNPQGFGPVAPDLAPLLAEDRQRLGLLDARPFLAGLNRTTTSRKRSSTAALTAATAATAMTAAASSHRFDSFFMSFSFRSSEVVGQARKRV